MKLENKILAGTGTLMMLSSEASAGRFSDVYAPKIEPEAKLAHALFLGAVIVGIGVYNIIKRYKGKKKSINYTSRSKYQKPDFHIGGH